MVNFRPHADGGNPLVLDDHPSRIVRGLRLGLKPVTLAAALGVPVSHVRVPEEEGG